MVAPVVWWNPAQRVLWILLLMTALFTWLGLLTLVHNLEAGGETSGPVLALSSALRWSMSAFAGLAVGFLLVGFGLGADHWGEARWPAPARWQVLAVVLCMLLAWLLWRLSLGFIALPAS